MKRQTRKVLALLESSGPSLHGLLTRLTLREEIVGDLMQELFIKLSQSEGFSNAADPVAYAHRAAMHLAFDWRRSEKRKLRMVSLSREPIDHLSSPAPSPLESLTDREALNQVLDAVGELKGLSGEVFVMHYIQQVPYEAIAKEHGKTSHQIRGLCYKAVSQIRQLVSADQPEHPPKEVPHASR